MSVGTYPRPGLPPHVLHPKHPERVCWGCDRYCPVNSLACGNGKCRTPHPVELFGEDWLETELKVEPPAEETDGPAGDDGPGFREVA